MMRPGWRFVGGLSILLWSAAALAQQPVMPIHTANAEQGIVLDVAVSPKNGGAPIAGLKQQDFAVLDNKTPQTITSFRAIGGKEAPVAVIVVIDGVNTNYTTIGYERLEIEKFFKANGGKLPYPTQLAIFTDTGTQIQKGFSEDGNAMSAALDRDTISLRAITRSAGFYGAEDRLQLSIQTLEQLAAYGTTLPGRKLLLWMSPGWPILEGPHVEISSKTQQSIFDTIVRLSTALREARMTVYSIDPLGTQDAGMERLFYYQNFLKGIRKPSQTGFGNLALQVIATQTGGLVLNSSNDLAELMKQAVGDGDAYYELSFQPVMGEPDEYHQIEVTVTRPGLVARTRTAYYSGK